MLTGFVQAKCFHDSGPLILVFMLVFLFMSIIVIIIF